MTTDLLADMTEEQICDLAGRLVEAMDGAYWSAPVGEGKSGAEYFSEIAVVNVMRGMTPGDAVAQAIGERGTYGVPRKYGLVPRPLATQPDDDAPGVYLQYATFKDRDECVRAIGKVSNP